MKIKSNLLGLLDNAGQFEILSEKEEKEVLLLAQTGDLEARNKMILHNLRLVVSVAHNFKNRGIDLEDLIQEGTEGLIVAIKRFDLSSGYKFSTYAYYWIMQRVYKLVQNDSRTIRVPVYIHDLINKINKTTEKLIRLEKEPTSEEIAKELDTTVSKIELAMKYRYNGLSLEYKREKMEFSNTLEQDIYEQPQEHLETNEGLTERRQAIFDALETLSPKAQEVLIYRYGLDSATASDGRTLKEVADIIGISKERVRQIEKKALQILRDGGGRTDRRRRLKNYIEETEYIS